MKSVTLTNDYLSDLLGKLEVYKTSTNKIRFKIGLEHLDDSLACTAIIVNGGQMAQIGFSSSLPEEEFDISNGQPYMAFNLSAMDFCNYASGLSQYKKGITISFDGNEVFLSIDSNSHIPLNIIPEENMEPLLSHDFDFAIVQATINTDTFINALRKGAYVAENKADIREVTDRAVFRITNAGIFNIYSSNGNLIAKTSFECKQPAFNELFRATSFLQEKGSTLEPEELDKMYSRMKKYQNDERMVALATEYGFTVGEPHSFGLSASAVNTIDRIFSGSDEFLLMVTKNNLHIHADNILATFALIGKTMNIYDTTVEGSWKDVNWDAHIIVDKEAFLRALSVLKYSREETPFHLKVSAESVETTKDGKIMNTPIVTSEGNISSVDVKMKIELIMNALSKFSKGEISLRFKTGDDAHNYPVMINNGNIKEIDNSACAYILTVR